MNGLLDHTLLPSNPYFLLHRLGVLVGRARWRFEATSSSEDPNQAEYMLSRRGIALSVEVLLAQCSEHQVGSMK